MQESATPTDQAAGLRLSNGSPARAGAVFGLLLLGFIFLGASMAPAFAGGREDAKEGRVAFLAGNYDAAIQMTTKAIESGELDDRSLAQAYNVRGVALRRKKLFDQAIADYGEAIRLRPSYAFAYHNRGIAYQAKGEHSLAIVDHSQAIAFDPDYSNAYAGRCLAFEQMKRREEAIADCTKALELDPDKQDADRALSRLTRKTGKDLGPLGSGADR